MSKPKPSPDDILTTREAAELLGLSTRQVCEHAEAGRLAGRKANARLWLFRRADVVAFEPRPPGRPKEETAPPKKPTRKVVAHA